MSLIVAYKRSPVLPALALGLALMFLGSCATSPPSAAPDAVAQVPAAQVPGAPATEVPTTTSPGPAVAMVEPAAPPRREAPTSLALGTSRLGQVLKMEAVAGTDQDGAVVLLGGLHGAYEPNTIALVEALFQDRDALAGSSGYRGAWYSLALANPDSFRVSTDQGRDHPSGWLGSTRVGRAWLRFNAAYVDLNRNWPTPDWRADVTYARNDFRLGAGGQAPGSEPEVRALIEALGTIQARHSRVLVISYHALTINQGPTMVQPSYLQTGGGTEPLPGAWELARVYHDRLSEPADLIRAWTAYPVSGEFLYWAGLQGLDALEVELRDPEDIHHADPGQPSHWHEHRAALEAVLARLGASRGP